MEQPISEGDIQSSEEDRKRQIIAEGLSIEQLKTVLGALVHNHIVNSIGTPSREEIAHLDSEANSMLSRALGGFIFSGMEDLFIDSTIKFVSMRDSKNRYDISFLNVPMSTNELGINVAAVAQVYPTDPNTPDITDIEIENWLKANNFEN